MPSEEPVKPNFVYPPLWVVVTLTPSQLGGDLKGNACALPTQMGAWVVLS